MGETHIPQASAAPTPSRLGLRNASGGGGHIVRSTGRKDRHSKVCTSKGPRDRRVRLSAPTAIQFYDVQDRLGYDRPSKAVDWLINKAKAAIAELPSSIPVTATGNWTTRVTRNTGEEANEFRFATGNIHQQMVETANNSSGFFPPSLDSDSIADTIKSFFPVGVSAGTPSPSVQFLSYPPLDLLSRTTSSHNQDLRLSLQSFQRPILLHDHHHDGGGQTQNEPQILFSETASHYLGFDGCLAAGWSDHRNHHPAETNRLLQRMVTLNNAGAAADTSGIDGANGGGGGIIFNPQPQTTSPPPLQPFFGQNLYFSQRGTLQSINTPSVRAWKDQSDHHHQMQQALQRSALSGIGIAAAHGGGFSGFRVPARIQGDEEEQDGITNNPSSASSDSRH